ncbi:MAG: hypothetical protein AAFR96_08025 [Planctomycetota bacterium]
MTLLLGPRSRRGAAALLIAGTAGLPAGLASAQDADFPVTAVTLYRSGVGSFEREGAVTGADSIRLQASADQIDDLLKSLVVLDLDGGRVGGVTYTADEPVARLLDAMGVGSPDQLTLTSILRGFKGSAVRIGVTGREPIVGRILGVDSRPTRDAAGEITTRNRVSLMSAEGIVTVFDDEIGSVSFDDPELRADFDTLLASLAEQRTERNRSLDIELLGDGERRVRAVYTQETPVWKTSYRIVMPADDSEAVRLQGWAIVENTTDSDWHNVSLSLVAGRPVGFTMPLSQPLYAPRQTLPVPVEIAAAARTFERGRGGVDRSLAKSELEQAIAADAMGRGARVGGSDPESARFFSSAETSAAMESSFAAAASAGESGEVFFYRLDDPVSVGRRQSAMLPILTESIEGRRVSVASPGAGGEHPMLGLEMTNTSDLKLMPGPVSVYDGTAFAGDASLGYVGAGEDRLIAFGVDLDVDIDRRTTNGQERIEQITIRDGLFIKRVFNRVTETVSIENKDQGRDRTVIVEVNALDGWDLDSSEPLYETTSSRHRFAVDVGAGDEASLDVTQSRSVSTRVAIGSFRLDQMVRYNQRGSVSDEVLAAFRGYAERQAAITSLETQIAELDRETQRITADQNRVRGLMGAVSRQDDLYARYLRMLASHEDRLEEIRPLRAETEADRAALQAALDAYVRSLNVE